MDMPRQRSTNGLSGISLLLNLSSTKRTCTCNGSSFGHSISNWNDLTYRYIVPQPEFEHRAFFVRGVVTSHVVCFAFTQLAQAYEFVSRVFVQQQVRRMTVTQHY